MNLPQIHGGRVSANTSCSNLECIKVETPIHDSVSELVTWECKEHGVNIMNVLANPKGSVRRWNLKFLEA